MMEDRIRVEHIVKTFGPTVANRDVNLSIKAGSVHGLAGENGSGKSTLASMICGIQKADSGKMYKDGKEYDPRNPIEANDLKVAMVVQELGIIGTLPPAMNMFLGKTDRFRKNGLISKKAIEKAALEQFEKWELPKIPMTGTTGELSIEHRKILELARALSADPDFLVLDEISQALSQDTREALYNFIRKFVEQGGSILMITHNLEEMLEICDTVSVLRDGEVIETRECSEYTIPELQKQMIGREVTGNYYRDDTKEDFQEDLVLKISNLSCGKELQDVNFDLHKGEILGICGLSDAGIHEVGKAIFGLEPGRGGSVTDMVTGRELKTPRDILDAGGAYLSKDRDADGLMLRATIAQNLCIPNLKRLSGKLGFLNPARVRRENQAAKEAFEIKCESIDSIISSLSGGNKQKVNLSRWLIQDLKFIILDCPTRGVDVGVKAYIYGVLKEAKKQGMGIVMITDELTEAMGMADRILVMKEHRQSALLSREGEFEMEKMAEVML